ncbi:DUF7718 family protein [Halomontanus rarus]|uniref:DUF7718 family protein n=1 Tax=Halomontanus rarus TaxID=3034020 RepID=UPI003CE5AE14
MTDELRTVWRDWSNGTVEPTARIRERIYWDAPIITEFCIQLEYNVGLHYEMEDSIWRAIARFDHNVSPNRGHDIREEGLHMDLFPKTENERKVWDFPRVPLRDSPRWCREFLEQRHRHYLLRYEKNGSLSPEQRFYD